MRTQIASPHQLLELATNLQSANVIQLKSSASDVLERIDHESLEEVEEKVDEILLHTIVQMSHIEDICSQLGKIERVALLIANRKGGSVIAAVDADGGVSLKTFLEWWVAEDHACKISEFMHNQFKGSIMLERSTANSFRYRIPVVGAYLADIFEKFESNKGVLMLDDYAVGQTTLEQIFNQFASSQDNPEMEQDPIEPTSSSRSTDDKHPGPNSLNTIHPVEEDCLEV